MIWVLYETDDPFKEPTKLAHASDGWSLIMPFIEASRIYIIVHLMSRDKNGAYKTHAKSIRFPGYIVRGYRK